MTTTIPPMLHLGFRPSLRRIDACVLVDEIELGRINDDVMDVPYAS